MSQLTAKPAHVRSMVRPECPFQNRFEAQRGKKDYKICTILFLQIERFGLSQLGKATQLEMKPEETKQTKKSRARFSFFDSFVWDHPEWLSFLQNKPH